MQDVYDEQNVLVSAMVKTLYISPPSPFTKIPCCSMYSMLFEEVWTMARVGFIWFHRDSRSLNEGSRDLQGWCLGAVPKQMALQQEFSVMFTYKSGHPLLSAF